MLAAAPALFLALFLLASPVTELVLPGDTDVATADVREGAPVVMVVFDELPTTSLLDRDGGIDRERYPSFAELAERSTWYSQATTVFDSTTHAVPAILDGRRAEEGSLPTSPSTRGTSSRCSATPTGSTSPRRRPTCARRGCARTPPRRASPTACAR